MKRSQHTCRAVLVLVLFCAFALVVEPIAAGEVTCFSPGASSSCTKKVLEHVEFKSVVAEFVDPMDTGVGHSLSRILWREIFEAIYDIKGAGVILAHDSQGLMKDMAGASDYLAFLQKDYHRAALDIAEFLQVQMAVWGVVLEDRGAIVAEPFLTLFPSDQDPWTVLRRTGRQRSGLQIEASFDHTRLRFAPLMTDRKQLFDRELVTRCRLSAGCPRGVDIRSGPGNDHPIIAQAQAAEPIRVRDMREQWFLVDGPNGKPGYINLYHLEIVPKTISFPRPRTGVNIRSAPDGQAIGKADFSGDVGVLSMSRTPKQHPWFLVEANGRKGWIAGHLAVRNWTFPSVHFINGAYRYARHRYDGAIRELERFIARGSEQPKVTLAAAWQLLAMSRVAEKPTDVDAARKALKDLDESIRLTPLDPSAFVMRAFIGLGAEESVKPALDDLAKALELDRLHVGARGLLAGLEKAAQSPAFQMLSPTASFGRADRDMVKELAERFALPE